MASLSNINGIFDVHSTGAILFSTSHGTSGQILRSNGNAAPTWVAASTVIGGPYLPLTGGTLTGATATATGISFTVGGNLFVTGTSTLTGALSGSTAIFSGNLKLIAGASTTYFSEKGYLGDSFNFGTGETTDGVSYTINGAQAGTAGNYFRWLTQTGAATPTEKVRITNDGSLVVGNTPGTNANWGRIQCGGTITVGNSSGTYNTHGRISGDSTSGLRLIGSTSGTYTTTMGITIAGYNVGINTTGPRYQLDLAKAQNSSQSDYIALGVNNGNPAGTGTALGSGIIWKPNYSGYTKRSAGIVQIARGSYFRSDLAFYTNGTANPGTDWSERMRIDMDGNVGIGETNPNSRLIIKNTSANDGIRIHTSDTSEGFLIFRDDSATSPAAIVYDHNVDMLSFKVNGVSDRVNINSSGNVGIGVTGPSEKLHVNGNIAINDRIIGNSKNYATSQGWLPGAAGTFSSQIGYYGGNFSINGPAAENSLIWGLSAFGNRALQWQTIGESGVNADGGWNKSIDNLPDGNTHAYMSYVYVKRTSSATTGTFYYGCQQVLDLAGNVNGNPYFHAINIGSLPQDVWCVAVGIIQAYTDTNTATPTINGIYRVDTGARVATGTSFKSQSGVRTTQSHRTYHYYSSDPAATLAFANPGFYVVDGTEPSLSTLVN